MALNPVTDSIGVPVDVSGPGDHVIYECPPNAWLRVFRVLLTVTRPTDAYGDVVFKSGTTPLNGPLQLRDGGVITLELNQRRWLETAMGQDLVVNIGGDGRISGSLTLLVSPA